MSRPRHPGHPPRRKQREEGPYPLPKTPREAKQQAYRETRPEYLPVKRQIHREIAASKQRQGEEGDWWNQYLQTVSGAANATQQAYANAAQQTQGLIGQASALDSQNTARLNQEAAASAAARGVAAPTAAFTDRANAAQSQRTYLADVEGSATAQRGANQFAYLTEQKRIGAGQRVKSMMDETARRRGFKEDLLAAKKEQGAQAGKNYNAARDRYREELLKKKAFGIEQEKAGQEARENAIERGEDRRENRRKAQLEAEDNRRANEAQRNENAEQHNQNRKAKTEGKTGGRTPSERRKARQSKKDAFAQANALYHSEDPPRTPTEWAQFQAHLAKESEISPADAAWAVQKLKERYAYAGSGRRSPQEGVHR
jgi:hypothetical protein